MYQSYFKGKMQKLMLVLPAVVLTNTMFGALNLKHDSTIYEHGQARLYCEVTCVEDDGVGRREKSGDYKSIRGNLYNLPGIWVQTNGYTNRVLVVSDKKAEQAQAFCQEEEYKLKRASQKISTMMLSSDELTCKTKAYATVSVTGWLTGKAYSAVNHAIVAAKTVQEGNKKGKPEFREICKELSAISDEVMRLSDAGLLSICSEEEPEENSEL